MASSEIEATGCPSTWPTNLLSSQLDAHNAGQGAIYTKNRRPGALVYSEPHSGKAEAIAREKQLKHWSRAKKKALIGGLFEALHALAKRRDTCFFLHVDRLTASRSFNKLLVFS